MGNVGTFCGPCWVDYYHPERHRGCAGEWSDGGDHVSCMCGCSRRPSAEVAEDGQRRRARRETAKPSLWTTTTPE